MDKLKKFFDIERAWKDFRFSYTKDSHCMLTNRELFDLFQAQLSRMVSIIEQKEPL